MKYKDLADFIKQTAKEPEVCKPEDRCPNIVAMQKRLAEYSPIVHKKVEQLRRDTEEAMAKRRARGW